MTSIEWLIEQLEQKGDMRETPSIRNLQLNIDTSDYLELKRQAKEMHKQEIINAFSHTEIMSGEYFQVFDNAEDYYQETFVSKGSGTTPSQTERMYSEEEVIKFGEMIVWNMVGKTITESFIRTVSKELFKKYIESLKQTKKY